MKTTLKSTLQLQAFDAEPILRNVFLKAEKEHRELQELFRLMGWEDLPDALKIEIRDDVASMVDELKGQYSSCDPYVQKRRERVSYWVDCYRDGICSLNTAIDALKVKPL